MDAELEREYFTAIRSGAVQCALCGYILDRMRSVNDETDRPDCVSDSLLDNMQMVINKWRSLPQRRDVQSDE